MPSPAPLSPDALQEERDREPGLGILTINLEVQGPGPGLTPCIHHQHREVAAISSLQGPKLQAEVVMELNSAQETGVVQGLQGAPETRGQELLRRPEGSPDGLPNLEAWRTLCRQQHGVPHLAQHLDADNHSGEEHCKNRNPGESACVGGLSCSWKTAEWLRIDLEPFTAQGLLRVEGVVECAKDGERRQEEKLVSVHGETGPPASH